jgi:hypothetical protein
VLQSISPASAMAYGEKSFFAMLCSKRGFFARGCVYTCKPSKATEDLPAPTARGSPGHPFPVQIFLDELEFTSWSTK